MNSVPEIPLLRDWRDGVRDTVPVMVAIIPFAALFGALAREAGFSVAQVMFAAVTIYAGSSQYVMLDLLGQKAAPWTIVLAVFVVNFRHVLYSASLGRHMKAFGPIGRYGAFFFLTDPLFALSERRRKRVGLNPAYYMASGVALYCMWLVCNFVGAMFGGLIENPATYGLDFILPLYFLSIVISFRQSDNFLPIMVVSGLISLVTWLLLGGTWHIMTGGAAGLLLAALLSKAPEAKS